MATHWPAEVDVFSEPHSRMKKLVHKYSNMVSSTDFTDEYHMANLLQNLINVFCEFKAHEEIENMLIMRSLKRKLKAASVTSAAVCNCHSDNRLTDMLEMVVNGSRSRWTEKSVKERQSYGHKLQKALEDFTQNFLPHMEEEEEVFQPMLMQYFTYEELKELKANVIREHLISTNQEKYIEDLSQKTPEIKQEPSYFDLLPDEICEKVFSYLNPQDLCRSAQTCHRWNRLTKDPSHWTGIYPVHWAAGNWTFYPEPLGGVDGAGELDEDLMEEFDSPLLYQDEDADVDESSHCDEDGDAKDYYGDDGRYHQTLTEAKILSSIVKHLLPCVGSGVKVVDLAYSKGLNNGLVHKILKLCPNVEVLDLTHTQVGDDAFYEYGVSSRQSKLRHLDLTNCYHITDQTLCSLVGASVDGIIQNTLDFEEVSKSDCDAEKESEIEIIPFCRRKRQNTNKCCNQLNSKPFAAKTLIDYERWSDSVNCDRGFTEVKSTVMDDFGNDKREDSETYGCDIGRDAGLFLHPHKLHIEGDVSQDRYNPHTYDDVQQSCSSVFNELDEQKHVYEHEVLCHKSERLSPVGKHENLTCGQTNSEPLNPNLLKNKNFQSKTNCCHDKNSKCHNNLDVSKNESSCLVSSGSHSAKETLNLRPNINGCCSSPNSSASSSFTLSSSPDRLSLMDSIDDEENNELFFESDKPASTHTNNEQPCWKHAVHKSDQQNRSDLTRFEEASPFTDQNDPFLAATTRISRPCCKSICSTNVQADEAKEIVTNTKSEPMSHLQFLSLNGCYGISDIGLRALSRGGGTPRLEHLDLSGCVQLTGTSVHQLVSTCGPQFDHANLFYCDNLSLDPFPSTASGCRNRGCGTRFCCSAD